VVSGRVDIVRTLLAAGAEIDLQSREGDTPLSIANKLRPFFPSVYAELVSQRY
jgi:hypothetical protein